MYKNGFGINNLTTIIYVPFWHLNCIVMPNLIVWNKTWGYRIHWLLLCKGVRLPNECPRYNTKQSDGEVPVMLELWEMCSTPLLPSLSAQSGSNW